ncbi:MAG: SUMF1/EgtB/PvdO family nonheme iron enzyme [Anaerolineales bacterium]|nr:SUMF1/EgtB/PvdO family nonheme iron enzyme [Anaerolineales bacterium]
MTQVFLSYSRKDLAFVEQLAADLKSNGLDVWYDLSGLEGGARWSRAIEKAIQDSQYMIVALSPDSMESEWVEKEFLFASSLKRKVIPIYYRPCELRITYVNLHYVDVQGEKYKKNFNQILRALNIQSKPPKLVEKKKPVVKKTKPAQVVTPQPVAPPRPSTTLRTNEGLSNKLTLSNGMDFMRVPAGKFLMGSTKENKFIATDERPQHIVDIPYDYWMARFPVTNEQYSLYAKAKGIKHPVDDWEKKKDRPAYYLEWENAMAYCKWLNDLLKGELPSGLVLRLPTEAEWEKAARGEKGNEYPWGNEFDKNKCNSEEGGKKTTTPVSLYSPLGDSPYGCADMAGNVWEWTHSLLKSYPYKANDGREDEKASGVRALRGGSFFFSEWHARCAFRLDLYFYCDRGFRVVASSRSAA